MPRYFIIDFDSTFVRSEGFEELAEVVLNHNPQRESIIRKIREITALGMEGKLSFGQSLARRLELLKGSKLHVGEVVKILKKKVSPSIRRNREFFKKYRDFIFIISGGFKEFIIPIVARFGIDESHVFANTFIFDTEGNIAGCDRGNPLASGGGKIQVVRNLKLDGTIYVIGDGYTDYEIKRIGAAHRFVAFTENVARQIVMEKADHVAPNFDEFLFINRLPRSLSYPKNRIGVFFLERDRQLPPVFAKEGYRMEEMLARARILLVSRWTSISQRIITEAERLMVVAAGRMNKQTLRFCETRGIAVFGSESESDIVRYINTGITSRCMNMPHLSIAPTPGIHRLIHIHRNVPGMLAKINTIMTQHRMNILMQFLKTTPRIGYVITDVDKKYDKKVLRDLKQVENTIRFRVLY